MNKQPGLSRRQALQMLGASGLLGLAGCASFSGPLRDDSGGGPGVEPRQPPTESPDTTVELTPGPKGQSAPSWVAGESWLYDDALPGPEIRATDGDVVGVSLQNGLPEATTVHWHGLPVANAMDGVPTLTQAPVAPEDTFEYRFRAEPPGTYFYHSHAGLQLDRGLAGPLVVEETDPHVAFDRDYVVLLDDYLPEAPRTPETRSFDDGSGGMGGPGGGGMGGMMNLYRPPYAGMVMNGHRGGDPPIFDVAAGERVRLRFINASSATTFQVRTAGHQFEISHADGRPVEPVTVDSFAFGPGERYDAIVTAGNPGVWEMLAAPIDGTEPSARGILRYDGATQQSPTRPETWGRRLSYGELRAIDPIEGVSGSPDRTYDLTLSPGGDGYSWAINGQVYPDADPLDVAQGDHVRLRLQNRSPVRHPMHLHGHFFQFGDAVKDTVVVPGHMGQATIDFKAENPGNWFFHCHNLYHLEAGMARVVRYVA